MIHSKSSTSDLILPNICILEKESGSLSPPPTFSHEFPPALQGRSAGGLAPLHAFDVWKRLWVSLQISSAQPRARRPAEGASSR